MRHFVKPRGVGNAGHGRGYISMTMRLDRYLIESITKIAELEEVPKSKVVRRLLDSGLYRWHQERRNGS